MRAGFKYDFYLYYIMVKIIPEIAELAGLFAADGSMQREHLCFWGNPVEDRLYYDFRIKSLFKKSFNIIINPHDKKSNSVYGFYVCKKEVLLYFKNVLGFPIGKKTYSVRVPEIIMNSKDPKILAAFLSGFFSGDGCLNFDKKYGLGYKKIKTIIHTYPRIQLATVSKGIIMDMSKLLDRLEIPSFYYLVKSNKENESDSYKLQISGKKRLEFWKNKVGIKNPSKLIKYEIFKKYGFVPPNLNFTDYQKILSGEICPLIYYPEGTSDLILK